MRILFNIECYFFSSFFFKKKKDIKHYIILKISEENRKFMASLKFRSIP